MNAQSAEPSGGEKPQPASFVLFKQSDPKSTGHVILVNTLW